MQNLKITLVQSEVVWEDIPANLAEFDTRLDTIQEETDLIILQDCRRSFPAWMDRDREIDRLFQETFSDA